MRLALAPVVALALSGAFSSSSSAAESVCALLDADNSPRTALLEAKLLAEPGAKWVERAAIDKVLKEQKLAAAFGAQGVKDRVQLGKLLKADVLVIVRQTKTSEGAAYELVVSETASGLRLLIRGVSVTKDAAADVAELVTAAREGIKKHKEEITLIVAAPPFVSNDLTNQFDHLKGAYAKLMEGVAFDRKGAVVVEFAEAEALSKELALTAAGAKVNRPAPLYLIGEYRHEGTSKDRTVTLKLHAERGGKPVGKAETLTVKAADGLLALRKWSAGVIAAAGGGPEGAVDPKVEPQRLNALAAVHRRLGNWAESLVLIEASLLLDPNQPEMRAAAIDVLTAWIPTYCKTFETDVSRIRQALRAHRRGLEHLEVLAVARSNQPTKPGSAAIALQAFYSEAIRLHRVPAELASEYAELRREHGDLYERVVILLAPNGDPRTEMRYFQEALRTVETVADKCARMERMLRALRGLPDAKQRFVNHLLNEKLQPATLAELEALRRLLDRLADGAPADVKSVLEMARKGLEYHESLLLRREGAVIPLVISIGQSVVLEIERTTLGKLPAQIDPKSPASAGTFAPIALSSNLPPDSSALKSIQGLIGAGAGVDVLWSGENAVGGGANWGTVFVMKAKGKLRMCHQIKGNGVRFAAMVYDGRFVWGSASREGAPVLFVFDPKTEKCYELGESDGLPVGKVEPEERNPKRNKRLPAPLIAVLGPGRVCVSGYAGRGWIGVATFQPGKGAEVKVIHEAKEARVPKDAAQWSAGTIAFTPSFMCTLRGEPGAEGKVPTRVLVVRVATQTVPMNDLELTDAPLLIDPDTKTVEVMPKSYKSFSLYPLVTTDRSLLWLQNMWYDSASTTGASKVIQIDVGGKVREIGPAPECRSVKPVVHFDGLHVHVVRSHVPRVPNSAAPSEPATWWVTSTDGKTFRALAEGFPHVVSVGTSSHYGLVAVTQPKFGERVLTAVKLDLPAMKK